MADRIIVLNAGRVEQIGSPIELYAHPRNIFVAGFIGSPKMNLLPARVDAANGAQSANVTGDHRLSLPATEAVLKPGAPVTVGLRPEHVRLADEGPFAGEVTVLEHLGDETLVYVDIGDGMLLTVKAEADNPVKVGEQVQVAVTDSAKIRLFAEDGAAVTLRPHQ